MKFKFLNSLNVIWLYFLVINILSGSQTAMAQFSGVEINTTVTSSDGSKQSFTGSGLNSGYVGSGSSDSSGGSADTPSFMDDPSEAETQSIVEADSSWGNLEKEKEENKDVSEYSGNYNDRALIPQTMAAYCELNVEEDIVNNTEGTKIRECLGKYIYEMSRKNAEERKDAEKEYTDVNYKLMADSLATAIAKSGSVANYEEEMNKYSSAIREQNSSSDDEVAITQEVGLATDVLNSISELLTESLKSAVFKNIDNIDPTLVVSEDNPYSYENEESGEYSGIYNDTKIIPQEMAAYCKINASDFMDGDSLDALFKCLKEYVNDLNNPNAEHKMAAEQDFTKLRYNMMVDQLEVAINNAISIANYEKTTEAHKEANAKQGTVTDNEIGLSERLSLLADVLNRVRKLKLAQLEQYAIEGIRNINPAIIAEEEEKEEMQANKQDSSSMDVDVTSSVSETQAVYDGMIDNSGEAD